PPGRGGGGGVCGARPAPSSVGATLKDEPRPIRELKPLTPQSLQRLVKTCLAKDPDERWQSAHDAAVELRWIAERPDEVAQPRRRGPPSFGLSLARGLAPLAAPRVPWPT